MNVRFSLLLAVLTSTGLDSTIVLSAPSSQPAEKSLAWAIPYGREFWREPPPAGSRAVTTAANSGLASQPFDLGEIMERVSHAFRTNRAGGVPQVEAPSYTLQLSRQGPLFFPHRLEAPIDSVWGGANSGALDARERSHVLPHLDMGKVPEAKARPIRDLAAYYRTLTIRQGDQILYENGQAELNWSLAGNTVQALLNPSFGMVEHWEAREAGAEVTWILAEKPPGRGPLVIETELSGLTCHSASETGHHFADDSGTARVRVGQVTAVDSRQNRWRLSTKALENKLSVHVPPELLETAAYPLAIDPLISPEFGLDQPVVTPAKGFQNYPVVASNGTDYLVVWADARNMVTDWLHETYGARISAEGELLDPGGIFISRHNGEHYRIASNGKDYLVSWIKGQAHGVRVSSEGKVLDEKELFLDPGKTKSRYHSTASTGPII